eukprot:gb/GEZJ01007203.1/.p1 GENE.gb/GEZJ01007203.1/~~gb/GEZJ01007203.1/.p1  ORF type:complete len:188 (+),score=13.02 gb/GEZJ01007203.1/:250-813(+)
MHVPSTIVAYTLFMNGVDRFDQFRSTTATVRKEQRVPMSILTFVLDTSNLNWHALLKCISSSGQAIIDIGTMKNRVIMQLVSEHIGCKQRRAKLTPYLEPVDSATVKVVQTKPPTRCIPCSKQNTRRAFTAFSAGFLRQQEAAEATPLIHVVNANLGFMSTVFPSTPIKISSTEHVQMCTMQLCSRS